MLQNSQNSKNHVKNLKLKCTEKDEEIAKLRQELISNKKREDEVTIENPSVENSESTKKLEQ
jgi:hypothetical protein